ncbi:MAG: dicarboxylate/amino acid:cation symporter [Chlamydiota bacterium]|nr:dicarboxylate/amino acid:cation symporter [Chlamydiota bacterium]
MKNNMLYKVLIAMGLAVIAGILTGPDSSILGVTFLQLYSLIGQLFLNALTLVVVPLVAASIITGTARMGQEKSFGALGVKTFGLYLLTTSIAVFIGWMAVIIFSPGGDLSTSSSLQALINANGDLSQATNVTQANAFYSIEQIFLKLIPSNILAVASQGQMLGLIFFSLMFGFFIPKIEAEPGAVILGFWKGLFQVMMCMTHLVMKALPLGVFGLVAKVVATTGLSAVKPIAWFCLTVSVAFVVYTFIALPLLLKFIGRVSPIRHFRAMAPAMFTAFSTSSSAATLPITIDCVEQRANVSNRICSFTVPLATSLNLSGTGLYNCVSVFFICQVYGIELGFGLQLFIGIISLLTSIGMAGIPSASIAAIVMILQAIGLPPDGVVLILAVERILDMFRTSINVLGNTVCAVLVAKLEGENDVLTR